ncbi:MAG: HAD family phosphatase [archaeon]|nr:HAD family phosphatase [archaeon]
METNNYMGELKALFYDMDGTLVYFNIDFETARLNAIKVLENNGIPLGLYSIENSIRKTMNKAKKYMKEELFYSKNKIKEIISKVDAEVVKLEKEAAMEAKTVVGIKKLMEFTKNKGLKQVICTFNTHEVAIITLKTAGLWEFFDDDDIIGRDDVSTPKPNKFHMQIAADKYSLKPKNCIMIGDHTIDLEMAKNFGCESIGINRKGRLELVKDATYVVKQSEIPDRIIEIIEQKI